MSYVKSSSVADEVVQEAWLAVIRGLDRFEGRSTVKTWIFRILINRAKSRGVREQRMMPFSSLGGPDLDGGSTVDPDRFLAPGDVFDGYWSVPPSRFFELPEDRLLAAETRTLVDAAIGELPERQQQVIRLRELVVERHLAFCAPCIDYLAQLRAVIRTTGQLREEDVPEPLMDTLIAAFRTLRAERD